MKLPHHIAHEFIKARGNQDKQKSIIESAPKEWLPLIKTHIKNQREWAEYDNANNKNRTAARHADNLHKGKKASI